MGALTRFRFPPEFIGRFPNFIETGTGKGVSTSYAVDAGFSEIVSIEIDERLHAAAVERFESASDHVTIVLGQSTEALSRMRLDWMSGILFWLDAHSPGGDYFGRDYAAEPDRKVRLPLEEELTEIRRQRPDGNYCIIVDDLRIYEDGDYEHGNLPPTVHNLRGAERHTRFLDPFADTHDVLRDNHDAGYLIIFPKGAPRPEVIDRYSIVEQVGIARRHVEAGDLFSARVEYQRVLTMTQPLEPPQLSEKRVSRGEACRFMAAMAQAEGHERTAVDWFLEAAAADPLATEYRIDLIFKSLIPRGEIDQARYQAEIVTRIAPDEARGWRALAEVERQAGDAAKMRRAVELAAALDPEGGDTIRIKAMLAADAGRLDEAKALYRRLLDQPRERAQALLGYSICQSREGDHEGALFNLNEAIALGSDDPMALWRRSDALLTLGRYAEGWADQSKRFELEKRMPGVGPAGRRFLRPLFELGGPPERVHVHVEQGYGDVICMARYVLLLRDRGHDVRLEVSHDMVDLFRQSFAGVKVVPIAADYPGAFGLEDFDSHVPIMTFPAVFGTAIDTVPWPGAYLRADPERVAFFDQHIGRGFRVGFCWASKQNPGLWHAEYARRKSMPESLMFPFIADLKIVPVSLQFGATFSSEDPDLPGWDDRSWADTAAVIANLDLVITVDTAVAHLAGAMGKPTWLAMHTGGSWHWMVDRLDSPWYPTARLFRQQHPHQWGDVVDQMRTELERFEA